MAAILDRAHRWITLGVVMACLMGLVTLVAGVDALMGHRLRPFGRLSLIDAGIILALAFGLSRRSRVCAGLLLAALVVSTAVKWPYAGPRVLIGAIPFGFVFVMAFLGTLSTHASLQRPNSSAPAV